MVKPILSHVSAFFTIILTVVLSTDVTRLTNSPVKLFAVLLSLLAWLVFAAMDLVGAKKSAPKIFRGGQRQERVKAYMAKLLSTEENCTISSNDLTWATGEAKNALENKAQSGGLTLIMPTSTTVSQGLEKAGARAHYYGRSGLKFGSRFPIVNPDRREVRVAIGFSGTDRHTIKVHHDQADPVVQLAKDLVALAEKLARHDAK